MSPDWVSDLRATWAELTDSHVQGGRMTTIRFVQAKGGAGTSTVAVALASRLAAQGRRTLLIGHDADALAAIMGVSHVGDDQRGSILHVGDFADADRLPLALAVLDTCDPSWSIDAFCGQYQADVCILDGTDYEEADHTYLVVRGPDYLTLRAACAQRVKCDGVVLVQEAGRALSASDVAEVLGLPVIVTLPVDASIARAVDAGVLVSCHARGAALDVLTPEVS